MKLKKELRLYVLGMSFPSVYETLKLGHLDRVSPGQGVVPVRLRDIETDFPRHGIRLDVESFPSVYETLKLDGHVDMGRYHVRRSRPSTRH